MCPCQAKFLCSFPVSTKIASVLPGPGKPNSVSKGNSHGFFESRSNIETRQRVGDLVTKLWTWEA